MAEAEQLAAIYADEVGGTDIVRRALYALGWGRTLLNLGWFRAAGVANVLNMIPDPERLARAQQALIERAARLLGDAFTGEAILDVASGKGGGSAWLAQRYPSAEITGLELVPQSVATANARFGGHKNLRFVVGDAERMPFAKAAFDRVICVEAAFHFRDRAHFLREVARVLKPGGKLVHVDFAWVDAAARAAAEKAPGTAEVKTLWGFADFSTAEEYGAYGREAGLTLTASHDWSKNVTCAMQGQLNLLAWLSRSEGGRRFVRRTNAALAPFTDDDFARLVAAASAHRTVTELSVYLVLEFVKPP